MGLKFSQKVIGYPCNFCAIIVLMGISSHAVISAIYWASGESRPAWSSVLVDTNLISLCAVTNMYGIFINRALLPNSCGQLKTMTITNIILENLQDTGDQLNTPRTEFLIGQAMACGRRLYAD